MKTPSLTTHGLRASRTAWVVSAGVVAAGAVALSAQSFTSAGAASSTTPPSGGTISGSSGAAASNGKSNGKAEPPPKSFHIVGLMSDELFPTVERRLAMSVDNPNNQAIRLYELKATISGVTNAPGITGVCAANSVTIGSWTAPPVTLPANSPSTPVSGYIPITLKPTAANACQGATFALAYTGKADKA